MIGLSNGKLLSYGGEGVRFENSKVKWLVI